MRKFILLLFISSITPFYLWSQDSLKVNRQAVPLLVIKGEDFSRFPSGNFLDAVNGLFPWVFSQTPDANNFLFIVNGFVQQDINGISLYDIDEVVFTRNKLQSDFYPFSRAGTFYIKTKTTDSKKPVIRINSQYNSQWNKDLTVKFFPPALTGVGPTETDITNRAGYFQSNQASLNIGGNKLHLYASAQIDFLKNPVANQMTTYASFMSTGRDTTLGNTITKQNNLKAFLHLEYRFSEKISAGITGNYFHGRTNTDTTLNTYNTYTTPGHGYYNTKIATPLSYYHLGAFINFAPLKNLRNKISFEYADQNIDSKLDYSNVYRENTGNTYTNEYERRTKSFDKRYLLRDQLEFDLITNKKFNAGITTVFSYLHDKFDHSSIYTAPFNTNGIRFWGEPKFTTLNPTIHLSFSNFISGYAGEAFILNKNLSHVSRSSKTNPYMGLAIDMKNLLHVSKINRLDISFDYGEMTQNNSNNSWLPGFKVPASFFPSNMASFAIDYPDTKLNFFKDKLTAIQLNTALNNNKLLFTAGWSTLEMDRVFLAGRLSQGTGFLYLYSPGKETQTGLSLAVEAKAINRSSLKWDTRFNILFPHSKYKLENGAPLQPIFITIVNYAAQAGLQNKFEISDFSIQANALLGINRRNYASNPLTGKIEKTEMNEFVLNYLLFGYTFSHSKKPILKNMSVFVQARNLLSSKKTKEYYRYDNYGGIGINVKI